jgi:hypothetical protein
METIENRIKEKEKELEFLRFQKEKEDALKSGALRGLENNILKDVVFREIPSAGVMGDGSQISVHFVLNDKPIELFAGIGYMDERLLRKDLSDIMMRRLIECAYEQKYL